MDQQTRERNAMAYIYRPIMTCLNLNLAMATCTGNKSLESPGMVANGFIVAFVGGIVIALSD